MPSFNIGLFLLAVPAFFASAEMSLRGQSPPEDVVQRHLVAGWNEGIGQCQGANCGLWGDPHMITCDGVGYDCQGIGTFNLMDNSVYKIQAQFVDIGAHEHTLVAGWGLTEGASITNDIAIEMKLLEDAPLFQFGFGALEEFDGIVSEAGCDVGKHFYPPSMPGSSRTAQPTIRDCHDHCLNNPSFNATRFSYWANSGCYCNDDNQEERDTPSNWPRSIAGRLGSCGNDHTEVELADPEEKYKHGKIGANCPLLFHVDGELVDISHDGWGEYLYGDEDSDIQVKNLNGWTIMVRYKLPDDTYAEAHFVARGNGPGELWTCHFDFWVCLPYSQQTEILEYSSGLMGTPDGNGHNDFIDREGNYVGLTWDTSWHKTLINYCYDNHCTEQDELIVTPPNGQTFEDIKCQEVEYTEFDINNPNCQLTPEEMEAQCEDVPYLLTNACLLDCCEGGCREIVEVVEEIGNVKTLSEDPEDVFYETPAEIPSSCEGENGLLATGDTACPSADTDVVKLISSTGDEPTGDVFFGIKMDSGNDEKGRTLRFMINNPFADEVTAYVKFGKSVFEHAFMDPKCEGIEIPTGCNADAPEFEVACHDYADVDSFALVQIYFVSSAVEGTTDIDECCKADVPDDAGVVMLSYELLCACPENNASRR